ncbi:MAG: insulinase family protein [Rhodocyclaceae bacterium]|nr:insulinase family protein [Rhodocyclaceae bacterium]MCB1912027.1 insulinase family protein [Rhodocyclaceae bacterium]
MMRCSFARQAMLACVGVLAAATCLANPYETTLENGLKVIVKEDPRAPSAVNMVWYRVGAMDEIDGTSGVAHVLEHMMFKGTQEVGPGEFNKRVAKVGGRDNAFTGHDYTAYFQQVPADRLGEMMGLEADRMRHLRFADEDFAKELEVVKEERRMRTDDKPRSLVYEQLMATAFTAHPYRRPIIGWMTDLEQMKSADARQWYRQWYAPNNAYVVVVGDVQHEQVFAEAERLYGGYKVDPLPARRTVLEPRQPGIRTANVRAPADLPYVMLAWRAPTLRDVEKDRDVYALQVLAAVLDGHDGARLAKNVVRGSQVALSAGAGYDGTARGESLFIMDGTPAKGHTVEEVQQALRGEITRIQQEGVSQEELRRVKAQAIAGQVYKRDSLMGQAMEIGMLEAVGLSWRDEPKMMEMIRSVTADEVQSVAKRYFSEDSLSVATLDPLPLDDKPRPGRSAGLRH